MSSTTALGALASRAGYLSSFGRKFGSGTGAVRGQQDEIGRGGGGIDGDLSKREAEIPHDVQTKLMTDCEKVSIMAIIFTASGGLWRGIRCCAIVNATCGCQRFTFPAPANAQVESRSLRPIQPATRPIFQISCFARMFLFVSFVTAGQSRGYDLPWRGI